MEGPVERENGAFWISQRQSGRCGASVDSSVSEASSQCVSRGCGSHTLGTSSDCSSCSVSGLRSCSHAATAAAAAAATTAQERAARVAAARTLTRRPLPQPAGVGGVGGVGVAARQGGHLKNDISGEQGFGEGGAGGGGGCWRGAGGGNGAGGNGGGGGGGEDSNICDQTAKVLGIAFLSIAQTVARTEEGMRHIEMKMEKTDEAVRSMAQGLEEQGKRMQRLEERVCDLEQRLPPWATGQRPPATAAAATAAAGVGAAGGVAAPSPAPRYPSCRISTSSSALLSASSARRRPRPSGPPRSLSSNTCSAAQQPQQQQQAPGHGPALRSCCMERFAHLGRHLLKMAHEGSAKDVRKLLDDGADVNFRNSSKWTPLHRAAAKGRADVVALLLSRGADVNARTSYGFTPLHTAACNDYTGQCVALLLGAWPEVDGQDRSLRTPLHYAAAYGNEAATRALLAAGASRTSRDDEGWTPLDVARADYIRRLLVF